jgi:hypothetical protein
MLEELDATAHVHSANKRCSLAKRRQNMIWHWQKYACGYSYASKVAAIFRL